MSPYPNVPKEQAFDLIDFVLEKEKDNALFDTAPLYGDGVSETWLGEALRPVSRERFTLSTKAGYVVKNGTHTKTDWSRAQIQASVYDSLARLGLQQLDVVHLHDPDCCLEDALDVAFPALAELRAQGLIRAVGAGMNQWEMLSAFARGADFDCFLLAGRYTLLEQGSLSFLDLCQSKGIAVFLGGIYNTGILATGAVEGARHNYRPARPEVLEKVRRIEEVCARHAVDLRDAAVQFPLAHPAVKSLVIGAQSRSEFAQTLAALDRPIPPDFWAELRSAGLISDQAPLPVPGVSG